VLAWNRPESSKPTTDRAVTGTTGHGTAVFSGTDRASLCAIVPVPSASNPALSADISHSDHFVSAAVLSSPPTGCPSRAVRPRQAQRGSRALEEDLLSASPIVMGLDLVERHHAEGDAVECMPSLLAR